MPIPPYPRPIIPTQSPYIQQPSYNRPGPIPPLPPSGTPPLSQPIPIKPGYNPQPLSPSYINPNYQSSVYQQLFTPSPWNSFQPSHSHFSFPLSNIPPKPARQVSYDQSPYVEPPHIIPYSIPGSQPLVSFEFNWNCTFSDNQNKSTFSHIPSVLIVQLRNFHALANAVYSHLQKFFVTSKPDTMYLRIQCVCKIRVRED